jgi:hypothetical protein
MAGHALCQQALCEYLDDAGQRCNVADLLHGGQEAAGAATTGGVFQLLEHELLQRIVHIKSARYLVKH